MKALKIITAFSLTLAMACGSPQTKETADSEGHMDSAITESGGSTDSDTTATATGSMSGSNGTGTDTTDVNRQKATRQQGQ